VTRIQSRQAIRGEASFPLADERLGTIHERGDLPVGPPVAQQQQRPSDPRILRSPSTTARTSRQLRTFSGGEQSWLE